MARILALALVLAPALAVKKYVPKAHGVIATPDMDIDQAWEDFKDLYNKDYGTTEEKVRRAIFGKSVARALERNAVNVAAGGEAVFGVTKFSDNTQDEFDRRNKGFVRRASSRALDAPVAIPEGVASASDIPDVVNWLDAGAVTPVKNQGQCGSCWANSATESVESQYMLEGNAMWPLSVQQVNSCTEEVLGCGGGDTTLAYEQLVSGATKTGMATAGLAPEALSPYEQSMYDECLSRVCTLACDDVGVRMTNIHSTGNLTAMKPEVAYAGPYVAISGYTFATAECASGACASQNLTELNANTAATGPPSICVNAANWNDYVGGVMTTAACGGYAADDIDHCVQLVGYNLTASEPYYLVRNSWATNWGEDGYIKLSALDNTCGLANEATFATIA